MKIKKGDPIKVVKGKDKGKTGTVEQVFEKENKVLVTNINQYKRHVKGNMQGQKSEITVITKPLSVANVAIVCPHCNLVTRVGYQIQGDEKTRICRKCEQKI